MNATPITDLAELETILKTDLIKALGSPLITFLANIQSNPGSITNLNGQWIQLVGAAIGAVPNLEAAAVQALAAFLQAKITAWTESTTTSAPAATGK